MLVAMSVMEHNVLPGSADSVGVHNFSSYTSSHVCVLCFLVYLQNNFSALLIFSGFFKFNLYFTTGDLVFLLFEN